MDEKIKDKLYQNALGNIDSNDVHPDNKLFNMYKYLISAITNKDSHGIMNQTAIENLFLALNTPVLSIEVKIISTLIFLTFIITC